MAASPYVAYASVILDVSIQQTLDYGILPAQLDQVKPGVQVEVPLRGHPRKAYVFKIKESSEFPRIQPIRQVISQDILVPEDLFELALWMAKYYHVPLSRVLKILLPAPVRANRSHKQQYMVMRRKTREELTTICKEIRERSPAQAAILEVMLKVSGKILLSELLEESGASRASVDSLVKKGYLAMDRYRIDRSPLVDAEFFRSKAKKLNEEQQQALDKILTSLDASNYETHLLHGVTGSGKTEVYLQAIDRALKADKGVIMLVPEIALTTQTIERFRSRFENQIAILHHRLSAGERLDEWHRIRRGEAPVVIGARSAVFSPVPRLGLLIVDEEHEGSYKSTEEAPCYHARDVAVVRGHISRATVILGSATPSLESYYNTQKGKYSLSTLNARADSASIPRVQIVDMNREDEKAKRRANFSDALLSAIEQRMERGEQMILFLNRRGYHTTQLCQSCEEVVRCPHCEIALTYHRNNSTLACHLCDYTLRPPPKTCPACNSADTLKFRGVGTEQVERALQAIFPDIRTSRMDADTTRHKGSHQKLLRDFRSGKGDILIGTQMIAKGLHLPQVTLVGILNADSGLQIPDFRASESVFQLITQVAGRAGRGRLAGEVIIQTRLPENSIIQHASKQEFLPFYEEELAVRRLFDYPPFSHLVKILFTGKHEQRCLQLAQQLRQALSQRLPSVYELNPVVPAGHAKIKDTYRFQFLIKGPSIYTLNKQLEVLEVSKRLPKGIRCTIDVDPLSTFF